MLYLPSPWSKTHSPPPIFNWVFLIVTSTTFRSTFSWITSWPLDLVMIYFSIHRSDFNFQRTMGCESNRWTQICPTIWMPHELFKTLLLPTIDFKQTAKTPYLQQSLDLLVSSAGCLPWGFSTVSIAIWIDIV
jgi:hypothetical protein